MLLANTPENCGDRWVIATTLATVVTDDLAPVVNAQGVIVTPSEKDIRLALLPENGNPANLPIAVVTHQAACIIEAYGSDEGNVPVVEGIGLGLVATQKELQKRYFASNRTVRGMLF